MRTAAEMGAAASPVARLHARLRRPAWLGTVRRTQPLSDEWGRDRGTPIDRYYVQRFLAQHRTDIRGRVLEVMDDRYTRRFGSGVTATDVLDVDASNDRATVVGDLTAPETLPADAYDCFVLTQTLHLVFDVQAAVAGAERVLRPGGVLLATLPSVSRLSHSGGDYWRFTPRSTERLLRGPFPDVDVRAYGNVLTGVAFLLGMACEELTERELDEADERFPVLIGVRAVKHVS